MVDFSLKSMKFIGRDPSMDALINILEGSVRAGKTWTMIPKLLFQLIPYDVPGDRIIFGVSKETIYKNVLNELFNFIGTKNYSFNRQNGDLWMYGQQWSVVGAKDEGSEKYIRGRTVGIAYGDELVLIPKTFFEMMLTRMSPDGARLYGTTNPGSPYHYLYTDYITDKDKLEKGLVWSQKFMMEDNLSLSEAKREQYRTLYKGVFKRLYIDGDWVLAEGSIYKDCFDDSNLYDDDSRPMNLSVVGGYSEMFIPIDYGTGNPTVFLHIIDDGKKYWVDREYYWDSRAEGSHQKTDSQYVTDLKEFIGAYCPRGAESIIDPSAASLKAECDMQGIWHCNAKNEVLDGIRSVSTLLGKKAIMIHKRCEKTRKELANYAWDKNAALKGEDAPMKQNDHAPDALRYFVHTKVPTWRIAL